MRAVLAGCGSICGSWLPHIARHPDLDLGALVDLHPEIARRRAEEFSLPQVAVETDRAEAFARHRPFRAVDVPAGDFPLKSDGHASIIAEFVTAVREGTIPETVCTDNIKSLAMVFGALKSAECGSRVEIPV